MARPFLFGAERGNGINPAGAAGGNPSGENGDDGEDRANDQIGLRIKRRDAEEEGTNDARRCENSEGTYDNANAKEPQTMPHNQAADVSGTRPESEPHRDFAPPARGA